MDTTKVPPLTIAYFDFDGTISTSDQLNGYLKRLSGGAVSFYWACAKTFFSGKWISEALRSVCQPTGQLNADAFGYGTKHLAIRSALKRHLLETVYAPTTASQRQSIAQEYVKEIYILRLRSAALRRIEWHHNQGHKVVICSGSVDSYLLPLCQRINIDALVCTLAEERALEYRYIRATKSAKTGSDSKIAPNCVAEGKLWHIKKLCPFIDSAATIYAYGDTRGDWELLDFATPGCAFYQPFETDTLPPAWVRRTDRK